MTRATVPLVDSSSCIAEEIEVFWLGSQQIDCETHAPAKDVSPQNYFQTPFVRKRGSIGRSFISEGTWSEKYSLFVTSWIKASP